LAEGLQHLVVAALEAEVDAVAAGPLHQPEELRVGAVDADAVGAGPGDLQAAADDRLADLGRPLVVAGEDVVDQHRLAIAERLQAGELVGAALRRLLAVAEPHGVLAGAEVALEDAAAR